MRLLLAAILTFATITPTRDIAIIGKGERSENERVLLPRVAPVIYVRQTSGATLPEKGSISCHWHQEDKNDSPVVVGDCEGNVHLVITGIDLNY